MTLMETRVIFSAVVYRGWTVLGMSEVLSEPVTQPLIRAVGREFFSSVYSIGRGSTNLKGPIGR